MHIFFNLKGKKWLNKYRVLITDSRLYEYWHLMSGAILTRKKDFIDQMPDPGKKDRKNNQNHIHN